MTIPSCLFNVRIDPLSWIVVSMILSGAAGGLVNHFLTSESSGRTLSWQRDIFIGIVAAFIVPLFLNMASGSTGGLLDAIRGTGDSSKADYNKLFVLIGFCLIAATSSRRFIGSISERVLDAARSAELKAKAAEVKANAAEATAKEVMEELIEPEVDKPSDPSAGLIPSDSSGPALHPQNLNESVESGKNVEATTDQAEKAMPIIDAGADNAPASPVEDLLPKEQRNVLDSLVFGGFVKRSVSGIARSLQRSPIEVRVALDRLSRRGLAEWIQSGERKVWRATEAGRYRAVQYKNMD